MVSSPYIGKKLFSAHNMTLFTYKKLEYHRFFVGEIDLIVSDPHLPSLWIEDNILEFES